MAVKYKIILLIFISCLFVSSVSCAVEPTGSDIIEQAKTDYVNALAEYENKIKYCANESDENKLDPSIFKKIKLTKLQLQISIGVFHFKALSDCQKEKFGAYLIKRGIYRDTVREFKAEFNNEDPKYYDDIEVFGTQYQLIKQRLKYLTYPKSERVKLEKIPELKQLFHLFSAIGS